VTRITGVRIVAAPCCGAQYAQPRYASMNFSAMEHWTDGWRKHSLMPNDAGLRRCRCGRFVTLGELVEIATSRESDFSSIDDVPDETLQICIEQAQSEDVELAARRQLWWHLNHPYRELYRRHRDAEETATRTAWEASNPDRRNWWDRLLRREPPRYIRQRGSPVTCPRFEPSRRQLENLVRLSELLGAGEQAGLELAELYREQGRFEDAQAALSAGDTAGAGPPGSLIANLIRERLAAPVRFRA